MVTARADTDKIDTIAVLQLAASDPPGRLAEWLGDAGMRLDVRDVAAGDPLPAGPQEHAGLVVLGGPMGAADDQRAPYLPAVRALLRDAVAAEQPTLGVCLGAQLLALANGGRIAPNPDGPELGAQLVAKRTAAATDPLWGPLPITPDVIQWHFDAITALPAGAILLAGSPLCENQAFRLGRLAWGIQFHIETTPEIVHAWARADAATLADYDPAVIDRIVERAAAVHEDVAEVWQPFVAAFADIVRDPDSVPSARSVPTTTAAPVTDPAAIRAALAAEAHSAHGGPHGGPHRLPMPEPRPRDTDG
ncbi:MAG TPA: type 1 glutamine amidotransferase [Jatrophihabitantaceae bacterium]|nr:type 1 glutamine amidotransferase [Jatrophihabitantaceae bacterium]